MNTVSKQLYKVTVDWSGYSRGYSVYGVEAESEEEAEELYLDGERTAHKVVRTDITREVREVTVLDNIPAPFDVGDDLTIPFAIELAEAASRIAELEAQLKELTA